MSGRRPARVVLGPLARLIPRSPSPRISRCTCTWRSVTAPVQLRVHLADPVDAVVVACTCRITCKCPSSATARVDGGWSSARSSCSGDRHPGLAQDGADRLDPELVAVLVDVVDQHRGGHFSLRSSSAAAKNADAVRRISFVRPTQLLDLTLELGDPLGLISGHAGAMTFVDPVWATQLRSVSGLIPSCSPTRRNAPVPSRGHAADRPPSGSPAPEAPRGTFSVLP